MYFLSFWWISKLLPAGNGAGGTHIFFRARPDAADDVIDREADLGGGLDRDRRHHTPATQEYPVRLELADLRPLRRLVVTGMRYRDLDVLKAVGLGQKRQRNLGLLAVGRVVIDGGDLEALELVLAAGLFRDEIDRRRCLAPKAEHGRKAVGKNASIDRLGAAVGDRDQRNLVRDRLFRQRLGDRIAVRQEDRYRRAILAGLDALIAFDALLDFPVGLAFVPDQLDAVDAALNL